MILWLLLLYTLCCAINYCRGSPGPEIDEVYFFLKNTLNSIFRSKRMKTSVRNMSKLLNEKLIGRKKSKIF